MTTIDTPEFRELLSEWCDSSDPGPLIAYIDAKIVEVGKAAYIKGSNDCYAAMKVKHHESRRRV